MKIYELLDRPDKWIKGAFARNNEISVDARDPNATCWCLVGALDRCYLPNTGARIDNAYNNWLNIRIKLEKALGTNHFADWNDAPTRTYEEVVNLCKKLDI